MNHRLADAFGDIVQQSRLLQSRLVIAGPAERAYNGDGVALVVGRHPSEELALRRGG
jgi:hypothetical protein